MPDHPPDRYTSTDSAVMARQIDQAKGAQIDAFVSAWYGPQINANQTEPNMRALLAQAQPRGFQIGALFETAGPFFHSLTDVKNALAALLATHATQPAYLHWNGKPVIFFWAPANVPRAVGQSTLAAWQAVRAQVDPGHNSLWIADGFDMTLLGTFDGNYLYNIAWAGDVGATERQWAGRVRAGGGLWVGTVMPGWDDSRLVERPGRYSRARQGGAWYQNTWAGAATANPDMIVITSWNEYVENTYIEPSAALGSAYLDQTRALASAWKSSSALAAALPAIVAPTALPKPPVAIVAPLPTALPMPAPKPLVLREQTELSAMVVRESFELAISSQCAPDVPLLCIMP